MTNTFTFFIFAEPNRGGLPAQRSGKSIHLQRRRHRRPGFKPWVGKVPRRRKSQSTPVLLPRKSHGQRSLAGYSARGHKEPDAAER